MLERSRPSVCGPSSSNGTIASSTVSEAIVRSSCCGFVTRTLISPGSNSTRRTSNSSGWGALAPIRLTSDEPDATKAPTATASSTTGSSAQRRHEIPPRAAAFASISRSR